ncbi:MAG: Uma2 family endonuclease [Chloroflexota bacterium]|nr:Uma2 family endonuclease [Chloroflexota bacterium]
MATGVARRRFTLDDYHKMAEAGILSEDDRVELIAGEIVQLSPIGKYHAACVKRLNRQLGLQLGDEVVIGIQDPVALGDDLAPQPDVSVLRAREDYYAEGLPSPEDILLVMEVADTSLAYDRQVKLPLYARAGVPETWLWDLPQQLVERHSDPSEWGYRSITRAGRGEQLASTVLPSLVIRVDDVLA